MGVFPAVTIVSLTVPCPSVLTCRGYCLFVKFAEMVRLEVVVMVKGFSVEPFDQLENKYSLFGVAVKVTEEPLASVLPGLLTVPPVVAFTVKLYC